MSVVEHADLKPPVTRHPRLKDVLARGGNNFDLIRLLAALTVIFGHSFYLFPTGGFREPVSLLVQRNLSSTLAVGVFFFISGMFIGSIRISVCEACDNFAHSGPMEVIEAPCAGQDGASL